jgi:hypothetical protein
LATLFLATQYVANPVEGIMLSRYHIEITKESIGSFFPPASLREIARANVGQDSLPSLFGVEAHRHVCDCTVTESLAYLDEEHAQIYAPRAHAVEAAR